MTRHYNFCPSEVTGDEQVVVTWKKAIFISG